MDADAGNTAGMKAGPDTAADTDTGRMMNEYLGSVRFIRNMDL
jgi:hypothetical protein